MDPLRTTTRGGPFGPAYGRPVDDVAKEGWSDVDPESDRERRGTTNGEDTAIHDIKIPARSDSRVI